MTASLTNKEAQNRIDEKYSTGAYTMLSDYKNNHTKLLIVHNKCGNTFERTLSHLVSSGRGCDYCYNGNSTTPEEFEKRFMKNLSDRFELLSPYHRVHEKIRVKSLSCGHIFETEPNVIMRKNYGCPKCAVNAKQNTEILRKLVNSADNGSYVLMSDYINNNTKVKIKHIKCGKCYEVTPKDFKSGNRCPICRASKGETLIANILSEMNIAFEREKVFTDLKNPENPSKNSFMRFDFYLPSNNLIIEYDGIQHYKKVPYFDRDDESLAKRRRRDMYKSSYAEKNGINLMRIPYSLTENEVRALIKNSIVGKAEAPTPKSRSKI